MKTQRHRNIFENFLKIFCTLAFVFILVLPGSQMLFGFVEEEVLIGAVQHAERSDITLSGWHSGDFQKKTEEWFAQGLGLRGHFVKTDNQVSFSVFREINSNDHTQVVLGKDAYLFEKGYIDSFNKRDVVPLMTLEERVVQLRQLQDVLRDRDIDFLLLLAPSKATVHPEFLPEKYVVQHKKDQPTNYDKILPLLDKHGVEYVDAHGYFVSQKDAVSPTFFARGGTHWSYYGLCQFAGQLTERMRDISQKQYRQVACSKTKLKSALYGADRDLFELINVWDQNALNGLTPYSKVSSVVPENVYQPNALFVGDSFLFTLTGMLRGQEVFVDQETYYYFNTVYTYQGNELLHTEPIDREGLDFEEHVFDKDLIIIEANETGIQDIGFGFVERALSALE